MAFRKNENFADLHPKENTSRRQQLKDLLVFLWGQRAT
jgi:hypothetical protein